MCRRFKLTYLNMKNNYSVINLPLQYRALVKEYSSHLKGKVRVLIGTKRSNEAYVERGVNLETNHETSNELFPQQVSCWASESSLDINPPCYSQLSSRSTSVMSFATCKI